MKFSPVGAELLRAHGRTDGQPDRWASRNDEANIRFYNFC